VKIRKLDYVDTEISFPKDKDPHYVTESGMRFKSPIKKKLKENPYFSALAQPNNVFYLPLSI